VRLYVDQNTPDQLAAVVAVSPDTPIRADTKVGIDFQGLTGTANILLTGGASDAKALVSEADEYPVLIANPAESRSWMQNAGRVLARIDDLIGRNSGRFDTILAGLERLAGGGSKTDSKTVYDLKIPDDFQLPAEKPSWQLVIGEPTVVLSLNSDKVQQQVNAGSWEQFADARWSDNLPNLVQAKIVQSFENAGLSDVILRPADALDPQFRLLIDIRTFHFQKMPSPLIVFDLVAKIVDRDGVIVSSRRFRLEWAVTATDEQAVINSFGEAFSSVIKDLVNWSVASL